MPIKHNSAVGLFLSHHDAESAVKERYMSGYDMKKLSIEVSFDQVTIRAKYLRA